MMRTRRFKPFRPLRMASQGSRSRECGFRGGLFMELNPQAEHLHDLVLNGNVDEVTQFIQAHKDVDVNWCNGDGYTALVLAIRGKDEAMVTMLLSIPHIRIGDAAHHAARTSSTLIMKDLVSHPSYQRECEEGWVPDSDEFDSDSSPIMMAALNNNYEMVKTLMDLGMSIPKPHPPACFCSDECQNKIFGESLDDAKDRLRAYKAYTSPAYILLAFDDPILAIFNVSNELHECAGMEKEFRSEYEDLADRVSDVAVHLLEYCNDTDEVFLLLKRKTAPDDPMADQLKAKIFCRFAMAIECKQRKFVVHPNCQQVIRGAWLEGSQTWRTKSSFAKCFHLLGRILFMPVFAVLFLVSPNLSVVKEWKTPLHKFISFAASYITFLVVLHVQYEMDFRNSTRGPPNTGLEWFIVAYVLGYCIRTLDELLYYEAKHFFRQKWNLFDLGMEFCFLSSFVCWAISLADIYLHGNIDLHRDYWHPYDVTLIGEIFYSYAFVLAFAKLLYFLSTSSDIGPMQTIIGRMGGGIFCFIIMFVLIMFAFSAGLVQLLHHYSEKMIVIEGRELRSSAMFRSTVPAMLGLFWAIFGYSPPTDVAILPTVNQFTLNNSTYTLYNHHNVTEIFGHAMFLIYYVVGIVIMINMLIAIMSDVFQRITESADVEWKFGRSRIWMRHLQPGYVLPPPYNLLPNLRSAFHWLPKLIKCAPNEEDDRLITEIEDQEYKALLEKLVRRYVKREAKKDQTEHVRDETAAFNKKLNLLMVELQKVRQAQDQLHFIPGDDPNESSAA